MPDFVPETDPAVLAAEAAIYAEVTAGEAPAPAPEAQAAPDPAPVPATASATATESAPPQAAQVSVPATGVPANAAGDLASVIAEMVRREAALAAAPKPEPAPKYRDSVSASALRTDPVGALKAMGVPVEQIAPYIVAELAPHAASPSALARHQMAPELQSLRDDYSRETQSLRQEIETMRAQERARDYQNSLNTFVSGISSDSYPLIGRLAKADAAALSRELFEVAQEDARARYLAGESGRPMTADEAAKVLEARYSRYQKYLGTETPPTASPAASGTTPAVAKPAPAATIASMSGAPPARSGKTLDEMEREIYNEVIAQAAAQAAR